MTFPADRLESRFGRDIKKWRPLLLFFPLKMLKCDATMSKVTREGEKIVSAERAVRHGGYCGLETASYALMTVVAGRD